MNRPTIILDVIHCIIEYLAVDVNPKVTPAENQDRRRDLLHLALASRRFKEPALDELWRSMESLQPLFSLLPTFQLQGKKYVLKGVPSRNHWQTFCYYASKINYVRYQAYQVGANDPIEDSTYMAVFNSALPHHFLPRLKEVKLTSPHSVFLPLFAGSQNIESVDFSGLTPPECHPFMANALTILSQNCNHLATVRFPSGLPEDILELATCLHGLRYLSVGEQKTTSLSFLKKLGEMRHLASLTINLTESFCGNKAEFGHLGFHALQQINVTGPLDVAVSILGGIDCLGLQGADIDFTKQKTLKVETLVGLVKGLAKKWASSLRRLKINATTAWTNSPRVPSFSDLLVSLKEFSTLEHLTINIPTSPTLQPMIDGDIVSFLDKHSKLQILDLPLTSPLLFSALIGVAQSCPLLVHLRIRLDVKELPAIAKCSPLRTRLRSLSVGMSPCEADPMELARRLNRLFPMLETIESDGANTGKWLETQALIHFAHSSRDDELDRPRTRA